MPENYSRLAETGLKPLGLEVGLAAEAGAAARLPGVEACPVDPDRRPLLVAGDADLADILSAIMAMDVPMRALLERRRPSL